MKTEDNKYLIETIIHHARNLYQPYYSPFLDRKTQNELMPLLNREAVNYRFEGGAPDTERRMVILWPDYVEDDEVVCPIGAIYVPVRFNPEHRKILGTVLSTGIKRENIGDILIGDDFFEIILLDRMSDYVLNNFTNLQGQTISGKWLDMTEIIPVEKKMQTVLQTAASERLDAVIGSLYHLSRSEASSKISRGDVNLNYTPVSKTDMHVKSGDIISVKRHGKLRIDSIGEKTKKGRIRIEASFYV